MTPLRLFLDAVAGRGAVAVFSILSIVLITRSVGVSTYGVYATATGFSQVLAAWTDLGSAQVVIRESVHESAPGVAVRTYLWTRAALVVTSIVIGAGIIPVAFTRADQGAAFVALASVALCGPSIYFPVAQMAGTMRSVRNAFALQGMSTLIATAGIIAFVSNPSAALLAAAPGVGAGIGTAAAWVTMRGHTVRPPRRVESREIFRMIRMVAVVGTGTILSSVYSRIDAILLLRIAGPEAAGIYAGAYRILDQTRLVSNALMAPVSPAIAAAVAQPGESGTSSLFERLRPIISRSAIGLSLMLAASAQLAVFVLLGPGFDDAVNVLILLSGAAACYLVSQTYTLRLLHAHRELPWIAGALACVLLNVALNVWLIRILSTDGAAIATVATELLLVVLTWAAHVRAGSRASSLGALRTIFVVLTGLAIVYLASNTLAPLVAWPMLAVVFVVGAATLVNGALGLKSGLS